MMAVDIIGFLVNQKNLLNILDRMQKVDDKLLKENIVLNYHRIKNLTTILIIIATIVELGYVSYNFFTFQTFDFESLYWFVTILPLYLSSLSKIWYIILVNNVRQKFTAINNLFENTGIFFEEIKKKNKTAMANNEKANWKADNIADKSFFSHKSSYESVDHGGYLHKEIFRKRMSNRQNKSGSLKDFTISSRLPSKNIVQVMPISYKG